VALATTPAGSAAVDLGTVGVIAEGATEASARGKPDVSAINKSRRNRALRPKKPEYAMTGILAGIVLGWIVGFGIELRFKQNMLIMMGAGVAGLVLGAGFEAIRFWWRMRRFRVNQQSET
jgi:hypothetical protein